MLESDRVDGIVELYDSLLVEFKRQNLDINQFEYHHISVNEMWLVYSQKNFQRAVELGVIDKLSRSIEILNSEGVFVEILRRHL